MCITGKKKKSTPGDVLDEERMPADPGSGAGTLRAGGKRVRKKRDINAWTVSIPTNRRNILCLGMSYPNVDWVVRNFKVPKNTKPVVLFNQEPSVEQAIELVRRNILNQIDGRDLARINALEADNDKLAYTVSKEQAAVWYEKRHLHADFNSRNLVNQMILKWGKTVRFHQVILDYFWSPSGSWAIKSWQRSFFNENIPNFVINKLFNYGSLENDTKVVQNSSSSKKGKKRESSYVTSDAAVVYLPFSSHCFRQVIGCYANLSKYYTISFLKKEELDEHTLWKATNTISPSSMQIWLAKSIDQEEKYCTLDYSEIRGFSDDEFATREDIINIFNRIAEPDEVRMIKLTALRQFHPDYKASKMKPEKPTLGIDKGGYVGLLHPSEVVLRRTPSPTDGIVTKKAVTKEATTKEAVTKEAATSTPGPQPLSQLFNNVFGPSGKITVDIVDPNFRNLMHYHYKKLGKKPPIGLPTEYGKEIFQRLKEGMKKRDGAFFNKGGEKIDEEKAARKIMRCLYLRMDTFNKWKDYQVGDDDNAEKKKKKRSISSQENVKKKKRLVCNTEGCDKPVFARGKCYHHDRKSEVATADDTSSDDDIYPAPVPMRTIGTQTNDLALVSDSSGHYAASVESDSSSSVENSTQARGLLKDDTTVDESSSSSSDSSQKPVAQREVPTLLGPLAARTENICTPHINDVLLVAGHHSHVGNVQFCNAVSMCKVDFSEVPECFSAALKSLSPPGRFLVKSVSSGGWKEIGYDLAPSIIPLIMDHHKLKSAHLFQRESLSFLARVDKKIESMFGGRPMIARVPEESSTPPPVAATASTATVSAPAVTQPHLPKIADSGSNTKEAVTNRCTAQTLQTFNIWHDENWRNKTLTAFGVDIDQVTSKGFSLSQLSGEALSEIFEQSCLSAHTLLTCVLDAEVKSLVKSNN